MAHKEINEEKDFSLHADPDAWNCKNICDDCINKLEYGTCDLLDDEEQLEARATNECELYSKKS